jgi:hypothetical protein
MSTPPPLETNTPPTKRKGKTFWSRVEEAGEVMALGIRVLHGIFFACLICGLAWWLGSQVWVGIGALLSILASPLGFLIGFFWPEVKLLLRVILKLGTGL